MHQVPESNASKQRESGGVEAPVEFEHKPGEMFFAVEELKGERSRSIYKNLSRVCGNRVQRAGVAANGGREGIPAWSFSREMSWKRAQNLSSY